MVQRSSMADSNLEILDVSGRRSDVWKYFGFSKEDKSSTLCKICKAQCPYTGNTSTMRSHLNKYHWNEVIITVLVIKNYYKMIIIG